MTATDKLLDNAEQYASEFDHGDLPLAPASKVAVLACMDACSRSPTTSSPTGSSPRRASAPDWRAHAFADLEQDVREGLDRIRSSPFVPRKGAVRGFVYEVESGRLREVV